MCRSVWRLKIKKLVRFYRHLKRPKYSQPSRENSSNINDLRPIINFKHFFSLSMPVTFPQPPFHLHHSLSPPSPLWWICYPSHFSPFPPLIHAFSRWFPPAGRSLPLAVPFLLTFSTCTISSLFHSPWSSPSTVSRTSDAASVVFP